MEIFLLNINVPLLVYNTLFQTTYQINHTLFQATSLLRVHFCYIY